MATAETPPTDVSPPPIPRAERGWQPYRLSVRQYLKMIEAGVFPDDARVELLGGILVAQMTKGTPHNFVQIALPPLLRAAVPTDWLVVSEISLRLGRRSRPEPDLMILQGPAVRYRDRDAGGGDTALLVEVADSTYPTDRGQKWRLYAAAGVPTYWIVHIPRRQVEVYRQPIGRGKNATYQAADVYGADASVPVVVAGVEVGRIPVREILP